jgi:cell filamentation protein
MTDPYILPGTQTLRNKLGITNAATLDRAERKLSTERMSQDVPRGSFDLKHLQAIHRHLFQDVYDWAGQVRSVEISKGGQGFMPKAFIERGMTDIHSRLKAANFLRGTSPDAFAQAAGKIIGDVNHVHPFREGNGRTQLQYLKQLGERAGHKIELGRINGPKWIEASIAANQGQYEPMAKAIRSAVIEPARGRGEQSSGRGARQSQRGHGRDGGMER